MSESREFRVGDVVDLRCGGATMVVCEVLDASHHYHIRCAWFDDQDHIQLEYFPADVLKLEFSKKPQS